MIIGITVIKIDAEYVQNGIMYLLPAIFAIATGMFRITSLF